MPCPGPASPRRAAAVTAAALAAGLLAASSAFAFMGVNPALALWRIFTGSFGSLYGLGETVTKAIPLALTGLGLCLAFQGRLWNIGAEGQLLCGAAAATGAALALKGALPAGLMVPLIFLCGFAGGAACGAVPGWLKARFRVNEVISSLLLNYVCAEFIQYLVYGPWKGKAQFGFPYTDNFAACATLPVLGATRIHWPTLALALLLIPAAHWLLTRTKFGFEVRALGGNPLAARYAGMDPGRTAVLVMALSGGLAGLAGTGEVAGIHHHLTYPWSISSGYGYSAIIVAWLARLDARLIIPAALFLGGILVGGDAIQTSLHLPASAINLCNGLILLCLIAGEFFLRYRPRWRPREAA